MTTVPFLFADVVVVLRPPVGRARRRRRRARDRDDQGDEPGDAATASAALVFGDELGEVLVGLGLEVAVLRRRGDLERVQQDRRQSQRSTAGSLPSKVRGAAADPTVTGRLDRRVGRLVDVDDDDGHVVGGAVVERLFDQATGGLVGVEAGGQRLLDAFFGEVAAEAVGADEPAVAGLRAEGRGVDLGGRVDVAEHAHQHAAPRVHGGLFGGDAAAVDEALHEGVVGRDLAELAVAEEVDARVADVGDGHAVADAQQGADGGAHAGELLVLEHGLGEQLVRRDQ